MLNTVKANYLEITRILFLVLFVFFVVRSIYYSTMRKHYNKSNIFQRCQWLVKKSSTTADECGNIWHSRKFKSNDSACDKLNCGGFLPTGTDFDSIISKSKMLDFIDRFAGIITIAFSAIGIIISLL